MSETRYTRETLDLGKLNKLLDKEQGEDRLSMIDKEICMHWADHVADWAERTGGFGFSPRDHWSFAEKIARGVFGRQFDSMPARLNWIKTRMRELLDQCLV